MPKITYDKSQHDYAKTNKMSLTTISVDGRYCKQDRMSFMGPTSAKMTEKLRKFMYKWFKERAEENKQIKQKRNLI